MKKLLSISLILFSLLTASAQNKTYLTFQFHPPVIGSITPNNFAASYSTSIGITKNISKKSSLLLNIFWEKTYDFQKNTKIWYHDIGLNLSYGLTKSLNNNLFIQPQIGLSAAYLTNTFYSNLYYPDATAFVSGSHLLLKPNLSLYFGINNINSSAFIKLSVSKNFLSPKLLLQTPKPVELSLNTPQLLITTGFSIVPQKLKLWFYTAKNFQQMLNDQKITLQFYQKLYFGITQNSVKTILIPKLKSTYALSNYNFKWEFYAGYLFNKYLGTEISFNAFWSSGSTVNNTFQVFYPYIEEYIIRIPLRLSLFMISPFSNTSFKFYIGPALNILTNKRVTYLYIAPNQQNIDQPDYYKLYYHVINKFFPSINTGFALGYVIHNHITLFLGYDLNAGFLPGSVQKLYLPDSKTHTTLQNYGISYGGFFGIQYNLGKIFPPNL